MSGRRGGIPGPESRTGLVRPAMTEAEFERRQSRAQAEGQGGSDPTGLDAEADDAGPVAIAIGPPPAEAEAPARGPTARAARSTRARPAAKPRRVQRMFAIEEELDKKLWLYAIHVGKDRSEVVNDLLRPLVASMVLYDSRDRRAAARAAEPGADE
jgi:hypothetical protein